MPFYVWKCFDCPSTPELTVWQSVMDKRVPPDCAKCGRPTERDYHAEHVGHRPSTVFPFVTTHLNGQPIEVKSESHLQSLCKQHGVRHRPDAAFIENDSGRGMPGSWY